MSEKRLRVGVIGCGAIAQIEWLPYLQELDCYEITAICDISRELSEHYGNIYQVPNRFTDWHDVLACSDIDAVIVLNTEHTELCIAAAKAGKDILVEKPLCENPAQARQIEAAVEESGVILMVGEMKRYDPGYQYAQKVIREMKGLRMIRSRDICDGLMRSLNEIYPVRRRPDVPEEVRSELRASKEAALKEVTGSYPASYYDHFLAAGIHDVEILRGAFGEPEKIEFCDIWKNGKMGLAVLSFGENVRATFEIGLTNQKWYEEELTAFGEDCTVRLRFPHPYLKNCPTTVEIIQNDGDTVVEKKITASYDEAFRAELKHFYECVTQRRTPVTDVRQGRMDVELMAGMFRAFAERSGT